MPGADTLGMIQQEAGNLGAEALGVAQFFKGNSDEKKAKQELARLRQPFYKIQDEYTKNQQLAEERATGGLGPDTLNYLTTEGQRGLGSSIGAITQAGGNPNDIAKLFDSYNNSIRSVASEDAAAHQKNIDYYMNANKDLAGQKTMQWTINEYQPYEAKLKELTQRRAAAEQNKWGGLSTAVSSMIGAGSANQNKALIDKLFAKPTPDGGMAVEDPYSAGRFKEPSVANTGGVTPSPAASYGGYIDPNKVPAGITPSPFWMGDVTN